MPASQAPATTARESNSLRPPSSSASELPAGTVETPEDTTDASAVSSGWWSDAVIYQIYPRSFSDSNGDGTGDLQGVIDRLPYLSNLGVDAIWLSPFYPSAGADAGYDVSDPRGVDPVLGTLDDVDELLARAHHAGIRVLVDIVPNHTSSEHPWFTAALGSTPGSPARDRYIFRPGREDGPPNDWESNFGGPAWTRVPGENQWYLHLFDTRQPDLDWRNPEVRAEYEDVLRFWLDRGVDGFRIDVAHGLIKAEGLPDIGGHRTNAVDAGGDIGPMWDQDGVHDIYRSWRRVLEEYGDDRILVAEAWTTPNRLSRYVRHDEMHQAFNFPYLSSGWDAEKVAAVIASSLATTAEVGASTTWVLSNHDVVRVASRLGQADPNQWSSGIGAADPQPDLELGRRRAAAYALLTLALPGSVYIYQGEELGLPDHTQLDDSVRQDPSYRRTAGAVIGRDGCRVPLPWIADAPGHGFGTDPWLPQPEVFQHLAADKQADDPHSFLHLHTEALRIRHELALGTSPITTIEASPHVLRVVKNEFAVLVNFSAVPVALDPPVRREDVLLASSSDAYENGVLQGDSAVWLRRSDR